MKVRTILTLTAIVSSILGAGAAYLALSVPNDLKADAMMKDARKNLESGKRDTARTQLSKIIQQYPRTDAAAAATIALVTLGEQERKELEAEIKRLQAENTKTNESVNELQESVEGIKNAPPKTIIVQQPAPKPAAKKKTTTTKKRHR